MSDLQSHLARHEHRLAQARVPHLVVSLAHELDGIRVKHQPDGRIEYDTHSAGDLGEVFRHVIQELIEDGILEKVTSTGLGGIDEEYDYVLHPTRRFHTHRLVRGTRDRNGRWRKAYWRAHATES